MLKILNCMKCGHEWASRLALSPRYCARCGRENWDRPKGEPRPQSIKPKPKGPKYLVADMVVGEVRIFPWRRNPDGGLDERGSLNMGISISASAGRRGWKIFKQGIAGQGLQVTRIS